MKQILRTLPCFLLAIATLSAQQSRKADVVVYGGTAAGVVAAVQTARMGHSVILLEPGRFIGGMTTGGLGATDTGAPTATGGIAKEFYRAIYNYYQRPEVWTRAETRAEYVPKHRLAVSEKLKLHWFFEPRVALAHLAKMLADAKITVLLDSPLDRENGVRKDGARITEIRTPDGRRFVAEMFIDATYEGDLMAAAGVSHIIGREPNSRYRETLNGIRFLHANRARHIDPFVKPGDPKSGLLPRIHPQAPGKEGDGDTRTQAYNFRLCLTDAPENRRVFEKPDGYEPLQYEVVLRHILGTPGIRPGNGPGTGLLTLTPMPNRKTDSNNNNLFSTDFIGANRDWPAASYSEREKILAEHKLYTQGLLWFLANDKRVPESIRKEMSRWGLAKDEFAGNDNWPTQLYVREARRMIGEYVVTEHDCVGRRLVTDPVALASYAMDSHLVSLFVDENNTLRLDGGFFLNVDPYPVSYRALLPKREEAANLIVPVALSSSHAAYGSIRMEPVFMMLGQSAATAACLAIEQKVTPHKLHYPLLRERLLADGQILVSDKPPRIKNTAGKKNAAKAKHTPGVTDELVATAIATLQNRGAIVDDNYWTKNAKPDGKCDGAKVASLIIMTVSTKQKVADLDAACDYMKKNGFLSAPDYWRQNAVEGKTCGGARTAALLVQLAKVAK